MLGIFLLLAAATRINSCIVFTRKGMLLLLGILMIPGLIAAEDEPKEFRHAITFVHPHTATTGFTKASPTEPAVMQQTDVQLPQTRDFGTFRLQYAYQNLWGGFAPWLALGGNLHKGFLDYPPGNGPKTEVTAKLGFGILTGISYRFDLWRAFYLSPSIGGGHYFSSQIDVDFPGSNATQENGCHEICVNGSVDTLLYGVVVGIRLLPFLAFELGLEHNLFFSRRQQTMTDGVTTVTTNQGTVFSDALMFSFGLTLQFNL
jgi:hypothetical protein